MQSDPRFFKGKTPSHYGFDVGGYTSNATEDAPYSAALAGKKPTFPRPQKGIELQPSETCPKNFVIFDHTDNKSRIMFHPALAHNFSCQTPNVNQENFSFVKEDTEDINALLSSEGEGEEYEDDDVVSTGRTPGNWRGNSPDSSCSSDGLKFHKLKSASAHESSSSTSAGKRERTRKMVKALRGIIPGGNRMDTPAVLDEAVRYLKSLKMEAKKLGVENAND